MKQEQCGICTSERTEVKVLLAFLRRKIMKQSQEYVPDYKEEEPERDSSDGFSRLLVLIFGRTSTSHATFLACSHTKFSRYLFSYRDTSAASSNATTPLSTPSAYKSPTN
jgi:hypothetical protein